MPVLQNVLDFTGQGKNDKHKKGLLEMGIDAGKKALGMGIPSMKKGGKVKKTGIYKLHAGETVIPTGKNGCKCHKDSSASMTE